MVMAMTTTAVGTTASYKQIINSVFFLSLCALIIVSLPFIGVHSLALTDYPNHLARFHILQAYDQSPALQDIYTIKDGFYPYWAIAAFMKMATPFIGVEAAGKLFTVISTVLPVTGVLALNKAVNGRTSIFIMLLACYLGFNDIVRWGFSNYLFTVGLSFWVFAAWIRFNAASKWLVVPILALTGLILASMHMIAVGVLGLMIGLWELYPMILKRKISAKDIKLFAQIALAFVPVLVFFLMQSADEQGLKVTHFSSFPEFFASLTTPFYFTNSLIVPELILGAIAIMAAYISIKKNILTINPRLAFVAGGMLLAGAILPSQLLGVSYFGYRLMIIAAFIFAASLTVTNLSFLQNMSKGIAGILLIKLIIVGTWLHMADRQITELRQAAKIIIPGSKVMTAFPLTKKDPRFNSKKKLMDGTAYAHISGYLAVDRDILFPNFFWMYEVGFKEKYKNITQIFSSAVPIQYIETSREEQCKYQKKIQKIAQNKGMNDPFKFAENWRQNFDYVIVDNFDTPVSNIKGTTPVAYGSWFTILKINDSSSVARCETLYARL